jgi:large subunit ribosomal protein L25
LFLEGSNTVENFTIEVAERPDLGKASSNRCRKEGFIPAVAYHRAEQPVAVKIPGKEFAHLASRARRSQVFTFKSSSGALNGKSAIVKEIQRDYIKGTLLHVDFLTFREDEEVAVEVPVKLVGEAPGVKIQKGILTVVTHEVTVRCLAKDIPVAIEVNISGLNLGQSIHVADLSLPAGVSVDDDEEETIVSVVAARSTEEEAAASTAAAPAAEAAKAAPAAAAAKAPPAKK